MGREIMFLRRDAIRMKMGSIGTQFFCCDDIITTIILTYTCVGSTHSNYTMNNHEFRYNLQTKQDYYIMTSRR